MLRIDVVETQDQVEHRGFAAAGWADKRNQLSSFGDEAYAPQHRRTGAISEAHIGELEPGSAQFERGLVVIVWLACRAVDHFVEHAHADQIAGEVEVEPRQAFRRLIGQKEREQKREKLAGLRSGLDDSIAAIDKCQQDRDAGEDVHHRRGTAG